MYESQVTSLRALFQKNVSCSGPCSLWQMLICNATELKEAAQFCPIFPALVHGFIDVQLF